jgi:hypothetical protein
LSASTASAIIRPLAKEADRHCSAEDQVHRFTTALEWHADKIDAVPLVEAFEECTLE